MAKKKKKLSAAARRRSADRGQRAEEFFAFEDMRSAGHAGIAGVPAAGGLAKEQVFDSRAADHTNALANKDGANLRIYFQHIPSGQTVSFKSFLTQFEDKFESEWNSETVYGRMDPIETFQGTRRVISLGWDVPSFNLLEAKRNLLSADKLINMLYPTYESDPRPGGATTIASSPLLRLKFANLIRQPGGAGLCNKLEHSGLVGRIGGLTYAPELDQGVFVDEFSNLKLFPQTIKLNCEFTVFHTHKLGWRFKKNSRKLSVSKGFPHGELAPNVRAAWANAVPGKGGTDQIKQAAIDDLFAGGGEESPLVGSWDIDKLIRDY